MKPKHIVIPNSNSMTQDQAKFFVVFQHNDDRHIIELCQTREEAEAIANNYNALLKGVFTQ